MNRQRDIISRLNSIHKLAIRKSPGEMKQSTMNCNARECGRKKTVVHE